MASGNIDIELLQKLIDEIEEESLVENNLLFSNNMHQNFDNRDFDEIIDSSFERENNEDGMSDEEFFESNSYNELDEELEEMARQERMSDFFEEENYDEPQNLGKKYIRDMKNRVKKEQEEERIKNENKEKLKETLEAKKHSRLKRIQ